MSYIVKNCPAITNNLTCRQAIYENMFCDYRTDCHIKQVIEKCNCAISVYDDENFYIDDKDFCLGESCLAHRILDLFDIEEINK